ncbi:hypothetical protein GKQ77_01755 [Streptomyces sp. BG9H]|uniref:Uncharacterized protein n=1 Tax=Streptomyces anatolicus TaxID=2675858 RepID=A0ABS6YI92_9ACTN|nr:DUF6221 family protein [Streptomyces anatolicus]MBW5420296.1 hypothetical protein [Streptomyces anatolicus]
MDDLVQWCGEQLDEDERIARAATPGPWRVRDEGVVGDGGKHWPVAYTDSHRAREDCLHVAAHNPARVLREIGAKRQVLAMAQARIEEATSPDFMVNGPAKVALVVMEPVLKSLASAYADRPGYREEWRL